MSSITDCKRVSCYLAADFFLVLGEITYIAELVASFFGDFDSGSLFDKLGDEVDTCWLALDSAVR